MVLSKKTKKLTESLIFVYLAVFPFGQIIRMNIYFLGTLIPVHPIDIVAGLILLVFLFGKVKQPPVFKSVFAFLAASSFSLLLSTTKLSSLDLLPGALYLLRMIAHFSLIPIVWSVFSTKSKKLTLFRSLLAVTVTVAVFGWIQYFWLPDLRDLKYLGWDDHYFRLFGTFLDPGFTGLILVFGSLLAFNSYLKRKESKYFFLMIFMLMSLLFTYSRASYLAFIAGFSYLLVATRKNLFKALLIIFVLFTAALPFLPRDISEGAKLERTYSIFARFNNWRDTISIYSKAPLFGVGYNNMCVSKVKYIGVENIASHACGGSDSSLLFVLATTGAVGFLIFINLLYNFSKYVKDEHFALAFISCGVALLVHSFFVNSIFYAWIIGFMNILLAISLKSEAKS